SLTATTVTRGPVRWRRLLEPARRLRRRAEPCPGSAPLSHSRLASRMTRTRARNSGMFVKLARNAPTRYAETKEAVRPIKLGRLSSKCASFAAAAEATEISVQQNTFAR